MDSFEQESNKGVAFGQVISINFKRGRGLERVSVESARLVESYGLEDDVHAGQSDIKQVSLLAIESIKNHKVCPKLKKKGWEFEAGDFGENITIKGVDFSSLRVGDELKINNEVVIEVSKIGRNCRWKCAMNHKNEGRCFILQEGLFGRVKAGGIIKKKDIVYVNYINQLKILKNQIC
jgi:MOSC domain-containing protein YiiM